MTAIAIVRRKCLLQVELLLLLVTTIVYHNSIREQSNLLRQSILLPSASLWQHLWDHGNAESFLLMTGVTREVFLMLLKVFYSPT